MYVNFLKTVIGLVAAAVIQREQQEELRLPELNNISSQFRLPCTPGQFCMCAKFFIGTLHRMQNKAVLKTKLVWANNVRMHGFYGNHIYDSPKLK